MTNCMISHNPQEASCFKMAARIRNSEREEDLELESNLKEQVNCNLGQSEIEDFVTVKYLMNSWSPRPISPSPLLWNQVH